MLPLPFLPGPHTPPGAVCSGSAGPGESVAPARKPTSWPPAPGSHTGVLEASFKNTSVFPAERP